MADKFAFTIKYMQKQIGSLVALLVVLVSFVSSSVAHAAGEVKKPWTMLVYLNGNNSLDQFGAMNLKQMQQYGSSDQLNIVVQWASLSASDTKRLYVQKDPSATSVTSPVVQTLPVLDMGDKATLMDFIKWGVANYPAEHYFIVVWNHGSGWHLKSLDGGSIKITDISYDDRSGHHISTEELGQAMAEASAIIGHKVDLYGSDACLMSMIEVASEMKDSVESFVGSEEVEPGDGWPYHLFLKKWSANPTATSKEVGSYLAEAYKEYYVGQNETGATMSVLDMSQLDALSASISALKDSLLTHTDFSAIKTAAESATRYESQDYVDLQDVLEKVSASLTGTDSASTAILSVKQQIAKTVVSAQTSGKVANGIAIWWPTEQYDWSGYSARYKGLKFDQASHWSDFLQKMF